MNQVHVMNHVFAFTASISLFSGLVLLLVDQTIYKVQQKQKEQKYAKIFGWINLSLAGTGFWFFCYCSCHNPSSMQVMVSLGFPWYIESSTNLTGWRIRIHERT
ncbi:CLC_0170 family protein [Paenibacillus phoenicis]|uniref:CLC_0170 family protein n=1 Tax=Paenibacillus phoenicis TaxID=554117 RepID=A0ABU5PG02_9BACL|nr:MULTISPECIES: CLC_0170 family protein [Paenibacillus]EES72073.1 hypothetical protein POTG_03388 [Paenibacillus sp. oral taxon 786 str. D14]MCT2193720.1 hypothetical protein [Paenibacillus sp. p3-SID1389]MEA3568737.1 CLC_0170 family protein [Paenibacillus phoenicis]